MFPIKHVKYYRIQDKMELHAEICTNMMSNFYHTPMYVECWVSFGTLYVPLMNDSKALARSDTDLIKPLIRDEIRIF